MLDYSKLAHHPFSEKIVDALCQKIGTQEKDFFRVHVAYYMSVVASMMRTNIHMIGSSPQPVNFYGINLAPSGL